MHLDLVRGDELGMPKGWLEPVMQESHRSRSGATRRNKEQDIMGTASLLALMMMDASPIGKHP